MVLCVVLGKFYCMTSGKLNTCLYLDIESLIEQCIGQNATARSSCTRSYWLLLSAALASGMPCLSVLEQL